MTTAVGPSGWAAWTTKHPERHRKAERETKRARRHALVGGANVYRCPYCLADISATRSNYPQTFCPHLDGDGQRCPGSGCVVA